MRRCATTQPAGIHLRPAGLAAARERACVATGRRAALVRAPSRRIGNDGRHGRERGAPGVGLRYEFDNSDGDRIGVIAKRRRFRGSVRAAAAIGTPPNRCSIHRQLSRPLAQIPRCTADRRTVRDLSLAKCRDSTPDGSRSDPAGQPSTVHLGDTRRVPAPAHPSSRSCVRTRCCRRRTSRTLRAGDVLVVIGTADGINRVIKILENG